ncbi:leucine-rich repeat-containing protein 74A-like [Gigantopelta aegis]|uniref:leucine-rich repeat-containing protein 74A-like n=1 Tax=Gigantopelta aegis TaxID=1735272 RepID=UPI001B889C67|nr:leucine-rich repeat-containing protein 74A-like [Gigantopelta aegis]
MTTEDEITCLSLPAEDDVLPVSAGRDLSTIREADEGEVPRQSSSMSKRTPSYRGSAKFQRRPLADLEGIEREAQEIHQILITQYGCLEDSSDDDSSVPLSEEERESSENEDDYDTDLEMDLDRWLHAERSEFKDDMTGEKKYIAACEYNGALPATYFIKHITDHKVSMRFHGIGPAGAKSMCVPLKTNGKIEKLDLEGNWIEGEGCTCVADMLKDNIYITELILSENKVRSYGAVSLCQILIKNDVITKLDLSGNDIKDDAAEPICDMLKKNTSLKHLYLSHNHFEEEGALQFKDALSTNETLETLDLSWNMFRTKGAIYIAEGIMENFGLKTMNFSMNGLGLHGAEAMGKALKNNRTLLNLDISFNRIPERGSGYIAVGLQTNDNLQTLKISSNPLGSDGALTLLIAIERNDCSELTYLELLYVWVKDNFLDAKSRLEKEREIAIVHGGLLPEENKLKMKIGGGVDKWFVQDAMGCLKQHIKANNYRLLDLFKDFDKDGNMQISRDEFFKGIQVAGLMLTEEQIDALMNHLDRDRNGLIDYAELIEGDKEYRANIRAAKVSGEITTDDTDGPEKESNVSVLNMLDQDFTK